MKSEEAVPLVAAAISAEVQRGSATRRSRPFVLSEVEARCPQRTKASFDFAQDERGSEVAPYPAHSRAT